MNGQFGRDEGIFSMIDRFTSLKEISYNTLLPANTDLNGEYSDLLRTFREQEDNTFYRS